MIKGFVGKYMNRFKQSCIALITAVILTCILSGCGTSGFVYSDEPEASVFYNDAEKSAENSSNTIAYLELTGSSFFFNVLEETLRTEAEKAGYDFICYSSEVNAEYQANMMKRCIKERVYCIIIDPVDSDSIVSLVDEAAENGIYVAFVDTLSSGGNASISVTFDNYQAGKLAAEATVQRLAEKYGEVRGTVLNIYGRQESDATRKRVEGVEEVISKYPGIKYYGVEADDTPESYYTIAADMLKSEPELDAIHVYTETYLEAVVAALKDLDRWHPAGDENHIIFTSIDATASALEYICEGYLDAASAQDAYAFGMLTMYYLNEYIFIGKEIELGEHTAQDYFWKSYEIADGVSGVVVTLPSHLVDKDNASDPKQWANRGIRAGIPNRLTDMPDDSVRMTG